MNTGEIAEELVRSHGYKVVGLLPSGWVLRTPEGRPIRERDLDRELEKLTAPRVSHSDATEGKLCP